MDAEAQRDDKSYGLSDYGRFARPELQRPQGEVEWSRRLAELMDPYVDETSLEAAYPSSKERCDIVWKLRSESVWLELKGAWRDYWTRKRNLSTYRSYLLHPLVAGLDPSKKHTVPLDLLKLNSLPADVADWTAELLIGFEKADDSMDADIDELVQLAGLHQWQMARDAWTRDSGQRVRCWIWYRRSTDRWEVPEALKPR